MIYPPQGSAIDEVDDPEPSQRAILWREIDERPAHLAEVIGTSSSWGEVVARCMANLGAFRGSVDEAERREYAERPGRLWRDREEAKRTLAELERRTGVRL